MSVPTAAFTTPRHWVAALVVGVAALMMVTLAPAVAGAAAAGAEAAFVTAANQERAAEGLPALAVADDLVAVARRHSAAMADGRDLHHNPSLTSDVAGWQLVGENVGRGPDTGVIHAAFMASPDHRANLLESRWTEVGIGVEVREGRIWVTQVFRLPAEATSGAQSARGATDDPAASSRSLVMLSRVAAADAALDAAS